MDLPARQPHDENAEARCRYLGFLATADSVQEISGAYFVNKKTTKSSQASRERWLQERLWKHSQQMVDKVLHDGRYIK